MSNVNDDKSSLADATRASVDTSAIASDAMPERKVGPFILNSIVLMDCIEGMAQLPDHSVDVAIADPPYNASKGGEWKWDNSVVLPGFGGAWRKVSESWDVMHLQEYVQFTRAWLSQLKRVVKPTGSVWIHGTYHNIGIINFLLQTLEVEIINEVIWYKRNAFPNLAGRRLTASHESILWAHTGRKREYFFDYSTSKTLDCPEDLLRSPGKQMRTVWDIPNNKDKDELAHGKHPTQKPLRLLARMLRLSARPGDICLVPFVGAGSECVAAHRLGLNFVGFEISEEYASLARQRTAHEFLKRPSRGVAVASSDRTESSLMLLPETAGGQIGLPGLREVAPKQQNRRGRPPRTAPSQPATTSDSDEEEPAPVRVAIPSLLKWTGSKRSQAASIVGLIPAHERYFEPFLGGGSVLYLAARPGSVAGDLYGPVIDFWRLAQGAPRSLTDDYYAQWKALQADLPGYFYVVRRRFNESPNPLDLNFLMRTCVNGIVRFNDKEEFNNSFHLSRPGMHPERFSGIVEKWHRRLVGVELICGDYEATVELAGHKDVVYFDPPYAGSSNRYVADLDTSRFFEVLERLNSRGVKWLLSFDGIRGASNLTYPVPTELFRRHVMLSSGHSLVGKVLNGNVEDVAESLYINF